MSKNKIATIVQALIGFSKLKIKALNDFLKLMSYVYHLEKRIEKQNKVIFDKISKPDTGEWKETANKNKQDNHAQYIGAPGEEQ